MKWHRPHSIYIKSAEGYTVHKTGVDAVTYTASEPKHGRSWSKCIDKFNSAQEAQAACEAHYRERVGQ